MNEALVEDNPESESRMEQTIRRIANEDKKEVTLEEEKLGDSKRKTTKRKVKGKLWMAEKYPITVEQLLPIFDILSHINTHFQKLGMFLQGWQHKV